jgi:trk system potassium uptake protein TrkH
MFIGGSPGGTAGGIKTTTLAVMLLTFAAAIKREDQLSVGFRKIPSADIIQAAATVMAAFFILLLTILMLAVTQDIPLKSIVFEAVSALGTVGLTLGATSELDEIGKLIIMAAMFTGRVGPLTLFLLLSNRRSSKAPDYPSINVPMT